MNLFDKGRDDLFWGNAIKLYLLKSVS